MKWFPHTSDAEIDRLLDGRTPQDGRLDGVAQFLRDLDSACPEESTAALEAVHVSAMLETASLRGEEGHGAEHTPADSWASKPERTRTGLSWNLRAHKWAATMGLAVAALLACSGAAVAGVLPGPIQSAASALVRHVGITIPTPHYSARAASVRKGQQGALMSGIHSQAATTGAGSTDGQAGTSTTGKGSAAAAGAVGAAKSAGHAASASAAKSTGSATAKANRSKAHAKAHKPVSKVKKSKGKADEDGVKGGQHSAIKAD